MPQNSSHQPPDGRVTESGWDAAVAQPNGSSHSRATTRLLSTALSSSALFPASATVVSIARTRSLDGLALISLIFIVLPMAPLLVPWFPLRLLHA